MKNLFSSKDNLCFFKIKLGLSPNLILVSFLVLVIIFFVAKYGLMISIGLTILWSLTLVWKRKHRRVILILFLFVMASLIFHFQKFWYAANIPTQINNCNFTITSITKSYVILQSRHWRILWWTNDQSLVINQEIKVIASKLREIEPPDNSYNFNFQQFLATKYVFYQFDNPIWENGTAPLSPRFYFFKWLNNQPFHDLVKVFTWQQPLLTEFKAQVNDLDWGYLLLFNSFALGIVGNLFKNLQTKVHLFKARVFESIYGSIWLIYSYLLSFNVIVLRYLIRFGLKTFRSSRSLKEERLLTLLIMSCIQPTYFVRLTSWFLLVPYLLWPTQAFDSWTKRFCFSCLLLFPLQMMLNYRLNLVGPFLLIIVAPIFGVIHCLLFLFWWCPVLYDIWNFILVFLQQLMSFIARCSWFWNIGHLSPIFYAIYFFTLAKWVNICSWKLGLLLIIEGLIVVFWNKITLNHESLFMLNVGNGNSFVYLNKFKNLVIVFDCGAGPGATKSSLADFLKWKGINHIDYLFISHFHEDHYNGLADITKTVTIKEIITNNTEILEWRFKGLMIVGWKLHGMEDPNDSSLVLLFKGEHANLLFMGDLTKVGEAKLLTTTNFKEVLRQNPIACMQLGHHGSKNATSFELLQVVNPKTVFISSGVKNRHQFPDKETIGLLRKLKISCFITQISGNLKLNFVSKSVIAFH